MKTPETTALLRLTWLLQVSVNQKIDLITAYAHFGPTD